MVFIKPPLESLCEPSHEDPAEIYPDAILGTYTVQAESNLSRFREPFAPCGGR
jgi:hypothetical protein